MVSGERESLLYHIYVRFAKTISLTDGISKIFFSNPEPPQREYRSKIGGPFILR